MVLIKVAWGGRSLAVDFRPPSVGLPDEAELETRFTALAFGPSSRFLVSAGLDGRVRLWDVQRARVMATATLDITKTGGNVLLGISPDLSHIVGGTRAGRLEVWQVE